MEIEVFEIKLFDNNQPIKATVALRIGNIVIYDFRVVKNEDQEPWISPPKVPERGLDGRMLKRPDGRIKYTPLVYIPNDLKDKINDLILDAYKEEIENENDQR